MPLAFESINQGTIAFGFFNIESDMLLLEHYFIFATDFCRFIGDIADRSYQEEYKNNWPAYVIEARENIGDLMGAIQGTHYRGFIGEVYQRFPFPSDIENFKQKLSGDQSQDLIRNIISKYARQTPIQVSIARSANEINIGPYRFGTGVFQDLVKYVWHGGYPRWQDELRPDYVVVMKKKIEKNRQKIFAHIDFD